MTRWFISSVPFLVEGIILRLLWYRSKMLPRERSPKKSRKFETRAARNGHQSSSNCILPGFQGSIRVTYDVSLLTWGWVYYDKLEGRRHQASGFVEILHILNELLRLKACKQNQQMIPTWANLIERRERGSGCEALVFKGGKFCIIHPCL